MPASDMWVPSLWKPWNYQMLSPPEQQYRPEWQVEPF